MNRQQFTVLQKIHGDGVAMDFREIATRTGYADGTALGVLKQLEDGGLVREDEHHEGVYIITPQGIAEIEARD